jgi:ABC-type multidrug transport system fused ATPase/permease subunit
MCAKKGATVETESQDQFSKFRKIWKAGDTLKIISAIALAVFITFSVIPFVLVGTSLILNGKPLEIIYQLGISFLLSYLFIFIIVVFTALITDRVFYNKYMKTAQEYLTKYYSDFTKSPAKFFQNKNPWFFTSNPDFLKAEYFRVKFDKYTWDAIVEYKYTEMTDSEKIVHQKEAKVPIENFLVILGVIDNKVKRYL